MGAPYLVIYWLFRFQDLWTWKDAYTGQDDGREVGDNDMGLESQWVHLLTHKLKLHIVHYDILLGDPSRGHIRATVTGCECVFLNPPFDSFR